MKKTAIIVLVLSTIAGIAIAWIDSRPKWDDTGITVFMVLCTATLFGYFSPKKPWLIALAVSIWIPLFDIASSNNFGSLIALIPGFIGAYFGQFIKKNITN
jgi:uncharacterized membrane protein YeaQ/YmgE (transglycosylase-associated protein family)